jgi:hypothetical protein
MRKIIVFPTKFAVIDIDYDKDDELYTARIRDVTEGLNAHVLPQQGKSIEEALNLMKISLETINNNCRAFVIDIPTQMSDDTLIRDCLELFDVKLVMVNSLHPDAAFRTIEENGIEGRFIDDDSRVYPAHSIWRIIDILKSSSVTNYRYNFVTRKI